MARIARVVAPGYPHHVTQRGNRRQRTFFNNGDYLVYIDLMAQWCQMMDVETWAWCLMPNHVHLVVVPQSETSLARTIGEVHRRYTRHINFREGWRGHLWQDRFASYPMDERHLLAAVRYIEMNPVAAGLVDDPIEYRWSSARAHLSKIDDGLTKNSSLLDRIADWAGLLSLSSADEVKLFQSHERTGRPLGSSSFIKRMERSLGRVLRPQKPGPKKKRNRSSA